MKEKQSNQMVSPTMGIGMCQYDSEGCICGFSDGATAILGYEAELIQGRPITSLFPMLANIQKEMPYPILDCCGGLHYLLFDQMAMDDGRHMLYFSEVSDHDQIGEQKCKLDQETGLCDSLSIIDIMDRETKRMNRYGGLLSMIYITINDYAKIEAINDSSKIDLVVQTLSIILKNESRDVDRIGRLDKALFVVVLPSTAMKGAQTMAQRLQKIAARYSDDEMPISLSIVVDEVTEDIDHWQEHIEKLTLVR